jgi:hypothetical protein
LKLNQERALASRQRFENMAKHMSKEFNDVQAANKDDDTEGMTPKL